MEMRKGLLGVAVTLAVTGLGLWSGTEASAKTSVFGTGKAALAGAPQGVDLTTTQNKADFTISNDVNGVTGSNSAQLLGGSDGVGSPADTGNSAIQISTASAGTNGSWGSIWSTDKSFDLTQPETGSMWIYASGEGTSDIGDGMAFVLQNDDRGVNAFAGTTVQGHSSSSSSPVTVNVPGTGESMGVWGVDAEETTKKNIGDSAIQNSWALEFDTHSNVYTPPTMGLVNIWQVDDGKPSSFDLGTYANTFDDNGDPISGGTINSTDNHIASNYPAVSGTYSGQSKFGQKMDWQTTTLPILGSTTSWAQVSGNYYYYSMQHQGYLDEGATGSGNLSDHRWHHITISYTPPTGTDVNGSMTYTYNDKNADTGLPQTPTNSATVPIKLSAFGKDASKVRWGFTGSTGGSTENNYVVFDQIPGRTQTSATGSMSADIGSTGKYQTINSSDKQQLSAGTPVKLDYTLKRSGGQEDWKGINGTIGLPANVVRDANNAVTSTTNLIDPTKGTITYKDENGNVTGTRDVDVSKIINDNQLSIPLAKDGSSSGLTLSGNETATITIDGTVKNIASTANEIPSDFVGTNASSVAKSPSFTTVQSKLSMDIDKTVGALKVNYGSEGDDAEVVGVVVPTDKTVTSSDITIHPVLNGEALDSFKQIDNFNPNYGTTGFQYSIPNDKLKAGSNTISFYATDNNASDGRSPVISQEITAGTVTLGGNSTMSFGNMALTGTGATLNRDSTWGLDVIDSRTKGSAWQLNAYADPLMTDATQTAVSTKLDGYLVYPDANGVDEPLGTSPGTATKIASGTSGDTTTTTNIASDWTDNSGIRLVVGGGATAGSYSGNINWTFVNSEPTT